MVNLINHLTAVRVSSVSLSSIIHKKSSQLLLNTKQYNIALSAPRVWVPVVSAPFKMFGAPFSNAVCNQPPLLDRRVIVFDFTFIITYSSSPVLLHTDYSIQHHATTPDYRPTSVAIFVTELDLIRIYWSALVIAVCGTLSSLVACGKKEKTTICLFMQFESIERSDCLV